MWELKINWNFFRSEMNVVFLEEDNKLLGFMCMDLIGVEGGVVNFGGSLVV